MTSTPSPAAERSDLIRALAVLCERPGPSFPTVAAALGLDPPKAVEHTELFVHQLPPYASIYLGPEGMIGGEARDRVAGFWRAVGLVPPAEPDHLAALLGLWATLIDAAAAHTEQARRLLVDRSQRALVWEHLASWLTPYLARIAAIANEPYLGWSALLQDTTNEAIHPDSPTALPIHLTIEQKAPRAADDVVPYLLAPIRSGIILTKADLHRAAAELDLGIRIGERAFALRSLLDQDRDGVIEWLTSEARRQAIQLESVGRHERLTQSWVSRARRTVSLLAKELRIRGR